MHKAKMQCIQLSNFHNSVSKRRSLRNITKHYFQNYFPLHCHPMYNNTQPGSPAAQPQVPLPMAKHWRQHNRRVALCDAAMPTSRSWPCHHHHRQRLRPRLDRQLPMCWRRLVTDSIAFGAAPAMPPRRRASNLLNHVSSAKCIWKTANNITKRKEMKNKNIQL